MHSGEGEYLAFPADCPCAGPAEAWLSGVVEAMRGAVAAEYRAALPAYEERPRAKWVFDWSAQSTVVASRTYFTQEVNQAFAEMEQGNEDALKVRGRG
jgi:dynein heavy chain